METFFLIAGMLLFLLIAVVGFRAAIGPSVMDRIVAVNMVGTKTTVLLIVIGNIYGRADMFIDFAMTYALLNFVGSLAAAKYFHKMRQVDLKEELEKVKEAV